MFGPAQALPFSRPLFAWGAGGQLAIFDSNVAPASAASRRQPKQSQAGRQQPPQPPLVEFVADRSIALFQELLIGFSEIFGELQHQLARTPQPAARADLVLQFSRQYRAELETFLLHAHEQLAAKHPAIMRGLRAAGTSRESLRHQLELCEMGKILWHLAEILYLDPAENLTAQLIHWLQSKTSIDMGESTQPDSPEYWQVVYKLVFNGRLAEARAVLERNQAMLTYHFDPQFCAQLLELVTSVPAVTVKQDSLTAFVALRNRWRARVQALLQDRRVARGHPHVQRLLELLLGQQLNRFIMRPAGNGFNSAAGDEDESEELICGWEELMLARLVFERPQTLTRVELGMLARDSFTECFEDVESLQEQGFGADRCILALLELSPAEALEEIRRELGERRVAGWLLPHLYDLLLHSSSSLVPLHVKQDYVLGAPAGSLGAFPELDGGVDESGAAPAKPTYLIRLAELRGEALLAHAERSLLYARDHAVWQCAPIYLSAVAELRLLRGLPGAGQESAPGSARLRQLSARAQHLALELVGRHSPLESREALQTLLQVCPQFRLPPETGHALLEQLALQCLGEHRLAQAGYWWLRQNNGARLRALAAFLVQAYLSAPAQPAAEPTDDPDQLFTCRADVLDAIEECLETASDFLETNAREQRSATRPETPAYAQAFVFLGRFRDLCLLREEVQHMEEIKPSLFVGTAAQARAQRSKALNRRQRKRLNELRAASVSAGSDAATSAASVTAAAAQQSFGWESPEDDQAFAPASAAAVPGAAQQLYHSAYGSGAGPHDDEDGDARMEMEVPPAHGDAEDDELREDVPEADGNSSLAELLRLPIMQRADAWNDQMWFLIRDSLEIVVRLLGPPAGAGPANDRASLAPVWLHATLLRQSVGLLERARQMNRPVLSEEDITLLLRRLEQLEANRRLLLLEQLRGSPVVEAVAAGFPDIRLALLRALALQHD